VSNNKFNITDADRKGLSEAAFYPPFSFLPKVCFGQHASILPTYLVFTPQEIVSPLFAIIPPGFAKCGPGVLNHLYMFFNLVGGMLSQMSIKWQILSLALLAHATKAH
jgi:hypothetical protein